MSGDSGDVTQRLPNERSHHQVWRDVETWLSLGSYFLEKEQLNPYDNNLQLSNSKTNNVYDVSALEEQLRGSYFKEDKKEVTSDKQEENVYNTIPAEKEFTLDPSKLKRPLPDRPHLDDCYTKVEGNPRKPYSSRNRLCLTFIILMLILAAGGVLLYFGLTKQLPFQDDEFGGYDRQEGQDTDKLDQLSCPDWKSLTFLQQGTISCALTIDRPSEVKILFSNHEGDTELIQPTTLQDRNDTVISVDDFQSVFTISFEDTNVHVSVEISNVNCSHAGRYTIAVKSEDGSVKEEEEITVAVDPDTYGCPCTASRSTGERGEIECTFPLNLFQTMTITKQRSAQSTTLLSNYSFSQWSNSAAKVLGDKSTDFVNKTMLYYEETDKEITLKIKFEPTLCTDEGLYSLFITGEKELEYQIFYQVHSNPQRPRIYIRSDGGLVQSKAYPRGITTSHVGGYIDCNATVMGCFDVSLTIKKTDNSPDSDPNFFIPVQNDHNVKSTSSLEAFGWEKTLSLALNKDELSVKVNMSKYKCEYTYNDRTLESDVVTAYVISDNFCLIQDRKEGCHYPHPFVCNKYIHCAGSPTEMPCHPFGQTELHFTRINDDCRGQCLWPYEANCTIEN